jgi:hypothetical protein
LGGSITSQVTFSPDSHRLAVIAAGYSNQITI